MNINTSGIEQAINKLLKDTICEQGGKIYIEPFPDERRKLTELVFKENLALIQFLEAIRVDRNESSQKSFGLNPYNTCGVDRINVKFRLWISTHARYYDCQPLKNMDSLVEILDNATITNDRRVAPISVSAMKKEEITDPQQHDNVLYYNTIEFSVLVVRTASSPPVTYITD